MKGLSLLFSVTNWWIKDLLNVYLSLKLITESCETDLKYTSNILHSTRLECWRCRPQIFESFQSYVISDSFMSLFNTADFFRFTL